MNDEELGTYLNTSKVYLDRAWRTDKWQVVLCYALTSLAASNLIIAERTINQNRKPRKKAKNGK